MALTTLFNDPFMTDMERTMNRMLSHFPYSPSMATTTPSSHRGGNALTHVGVPSMPMDIVETSSAYELHADAPGMSPTDIKVELHEGVLTVSGQRKIERHDKAADGKVWRSERSAYSFARSFTLPDNAIPEGITAAVDKGVLKVTVPKREPQPKQQQPVRIAVTGA